MNFKKHLELKGKHALFSPSSNAWLRYDEQKIEEKIFSQYRAPLGTEIHEFAEAKIEMGQKIGSTRELRKDISYEIYKKYKDKSIAENSETYSEYCKKLLKYFYYLSDDIFETVKQYINDAIGFKMTPEQPLYYSDYIFGTTDAISFRDNYLRIHDLKTGSLPAHMDQLYIYAALFCLEYKIRPGDISMELRLYQSTEILVANPTAEDISPVIDQIISTGKVASRIESQEE